MIPRWTIVVALAAVALVAPITQASLVASPPTGVVASWTQLVPASVSPSQLQARAVVPRGTPCPKMKVATRTGRVTYVAMAMRSPGATTGPAFASLRACTAPLPVGLVSASAGAIAIPAALPSRVDRIAAFGDIGCRVSPQIPQDCSDPSQWPAARVARRVAREAPDVIVFTGDFLYREGACPGTMMSTCGGSPGPAFTATPGAFLPFNDTDYSWMADALIPMTPAFAAAPILVVRGNHESCLRGGNGWMMFFEVMLPPDACAPDIVGPEGTTPKTISPSYAIDLHVTSQRSLRLVMVDSNEGSDTAIGSWTPTQRKAYAAADRLAAPRKGRESWLVTHRPMFGVDVTPQSPAGALGWTSITQTAAGQGFTGRYSLMLGSHVHAAQAVQVPGQPAQLVVGNGGSIPDSVDPVHYALPAYGPMRNALGEPLVDQNTGRPVIPYEKASYLKTWVRYGFAMLAPERQSDNWTISERGVDGREFATCHVVKRRVSCAP